MAECHHPRCEASIPSDRYACRPHWYQLPVPIRERIWSTWRAFMSGIPFGTARETAEADALAWWEAHP